MIESYRDLDVWKLGVELAVACYEVTRALPAEERYGLTSQIRRSAASVPANIAEGYGRDTPGDYVRSLRIAQGSLKELETHVIIADRVGGITPDRAEEVLRQTDRVGRMLRGLIRSIQAAT